MLVSAGIRGSNVVLGNRFAADDSVLQYVSLSLVSSFSFHTTNILQIIQIVKGILQLFLRSERTMMPEMVGLQSLLGFTGYASEEMCDSLICHSL